VRTTLELAARRRGAAGEVGGLARLRDPAARSRSGAVVLTGGSRRSAAVALPPRHA
jgi:hypothetical protein